MENKADNNICPNCKKEIIDNVLFQCVRCFTIYCKSCPDTDTGNRCPKCRMSPRIVLDKGEGC